jgi:NAD(P)-dependent dehydrogenase (short-subunit alcohol dehydrogenase family)
MIKSVLITGANAGLGKETARQLASNLNIDKIILGCRNPDKAQQAKQELTAATGRDIYEVLIIDVSNLESVRDAVKKLTQPVDALLMNAGGSGGSNFNRITEYDVTRIFAVNLLGHALLAEELITSGKLTHTAIYAGSEAARGVKEMGMQRPELANSSVNEFITIANGSFYKPTNDATVPYGPIKYMAALWVSAMAKKYPQIRFITISPGATTGTEGFNTLTPLKRWFMKSMMQVMLLLGKVHKLEIGAKRFVDGLLDSSYKSGIFYASEKGLTGPMGDQSLIFSDLADTQIQNNAQQAIEKLLNSQRTLG